MRTFAEGVFVLLLRMLAATWRVRAEGALPPKRCVVAFWHGGMLPVWKYFSFSRASAVVSRSSDGAVLAALLESWGYSVIRGSSSKGGKESLAAMIDAAKNGRILVTPDGPRGPKGVMKPGAVIAAQRSGANLSCCRVQISWKITLRSWDNFAVPLPFSRILLTFLPPLHFPASLASEDITAAISAAGASLGEWP